MIPQEREPPETFIESEHFDGDEQTPDLICDNCGAIYQFKGFNKPEVNQCDFSQNNKKEDGIPPTNKLVGILPKRLWHTPKINHTKVWGFSRRSSNLNLSVCGHESYKRASTQRKTPKRLIYITKTGDVKWLKQDSNTLIQKNTRLKAK